MPDFPAVNAGLNALAGVLLVCGWAAIKARRVPLHRACMVSAFAVSTFFLMSYLYYHVVIKSGQPTRFPVDGLPKTVYLTILVSHTILAIVVAILAPTSLILAIRGSLPRHRAVARWTLPMWLYVSMTGVVVYWMLYRMYPPVG